MKKLLTLAIVLLLCKVSLAQDLQSQIRQVIQDGSSKTVKIMEDKGTGSGFIISQDGFIVTAYHVVKEAKTVEVITNSGKTYHADVIGTAKTKDLALVKINGINLPFFEMADSDKVFVGQFAVAIGYPFGEYSANFGIIGNTMEPMSDRIFSLKSDVPINPGNSGGPLLDLEGRVIGINDAVYDGANTVSYSIPSNTLTGILVKLRSNKPIEAGYAGVTVQLLTSDLSLKFGASEHQFGLLVSDIADGTNASESGLQVGDIIIIANTHEVKGTLFFATLVAGLEPGDLLHLVILRDGQQKLIQFEVNHRPEEAK